MAEAGESPLRLPGRSDSYFSASFTFSPAFFTDAFV